MSETQKELNTLVPEILISRFQRVYSDFFKQRPGFSQFPAFFRYHIYLPKNKEKRDIALEKLCSKLKVITGDKMTKNVANLVELNKLTDTLDAELVNYFTHKAWSPPKQEKVNTWSKKWMWSKLHRMGEIGQKQGDEQEQITEQDLFRAMKELGQVEQRILQIKLICETLNFFFSLSRLPAISLVLAPIKVAAFMVGAGCLIETVEAGYRLAVNIQQEDIRDFLVAFRKRETSNLRAMIQ